MIDATRDGIPDAARLISDADWADDEPAVHAEHGPLLKAFSWLNPKILWHSRNNVLASISGDPTELARVAWVSAQRQRLAAAGRPPAEVEDFMLERPDLDDFNFLVMGDTGEGDVGQYSLVPSLLKVGENTEFALIASDVVYPEGDVNQYIAKFFIPYAAYPQPIYAVPGNHDWLDGLVGFMRHFCDAPPTGAKFLPPRHGRRPRTASLLHRVFWRRAGELAPSTLAEAEALRGAARDRGPRQPNMYFCIDTPQLRIIGVDTGILGRLDYDQGEWLKLVAAGPKPKLLISGSPIYSGDGVSPRRILGRDGHGAVGSLLGVLRNPANNFVAALAGDVHHYERHAVRVDDGRTLNFVITGGGGAFMTSTHQIGRVDLPGVDESGWVSYPTRGDSLRAFSIVLMRRWRKLVPWGRDRIPRGIPADQAERIMAERHGLPVPDPSVRVSLRSRLISELLYPRVQPIESSKVSELLDWDDPPFLKHALRVEVEDGVLRLRAFAISGRESDAGEPVEFDGFEVELAERAEAGAAGGGEVARG